MPLVDGVRAAGAGLSQFSIARNRSLVYVPGPSGDRDDLSLMWVTRTGEETPTAPALRPLSTAATTRTCGSGISTRVP